MPENSNTALQPNFQPVAQILIKKLRLQEKKTSNQEDEQNPQETMRKPLEIFRG